MRFAVDARCLGPERITGVGVYAQHLVRALAKKSDHAQMELWLPWRKRAMSDRVQERTGIKPDTISEWTRILRPPDLVFGPDFKCPRWGPFKKVITIHDVAEFEPEFSHTKFMALARQNMTRTLVKHRPDHIIADTDFTVGRIHAAYPDLKIPVSRVHLGADHFQPIDKSKTLRPHDKPYALCVGTVETRKNQICAVQAFEIFKAKHPESPLELILIGGAGPGSDLVEDSLRQSRAAESIHWRRSVSHDELVRYYGFATVFLFPSLYEGFGIPILEAMRAQVPVITSPLGAMKEVAGPAALFANPRDPSEWAEQLHHLLTNQNLQNELAALGEIHSRMFTWDRCAEATLEIFNQTKLSIPL